MKDYYALTSTGKARRLRDLALRALEHYDLHVARLSLITNEQNGIFRVDTGDGTRLVMRVARPDTGHPLSHLESEMTYLRALAEDGSVPAPHPVPARNGELAVTETAPGVPEPRHCGLFTWVPGADLAERRSPENWRKLGELSARLHAFGREWRTPKGFAATVNDSPFCFDEEMVFFRAPYSDLFSQEDARDLRTGVDLVQRDIDALHAGRDIVITHGDLHQWNVRVSRGVLYPIDFEDLLIQHPLQDVAITLYYHQGDADFEQLASAFRAGYESVAAWPELWEGQLELHMLARRMNLVNYILYSRDEDIADYPHAIPLLMRRVRDALARPGSPRTA
jgi:Ser/Thr protein kinase RdoA (MazF antagonist)